MPGTSALSDPVATFDPPAKMARTYTSHAGDATRLYVTTSKEGEGNPRFEDMSSPLQRNLHRVTREGNVEEPAFGMPSPQQSDVVPPLRWDVHRRKWEATTVPRLLLDISPSCSLSPSQGADAAPLKPYTGKGTECGHFATITLTEPGSITTTAECPPGGAE